MADDTIDLEELAANATFAEAPDSTDPIAPQPDPENPPLISEESARERENFVLRALQGGNTRPRERKRRDKPVKSAETVPNMPRKGQLARQITQLYVSLGTFLMPFDQACAGAVINAAPKCGEAMENLARENPAVRKAILAMVETSVWGQVIIAHAPIMLAIAIHHVPAVRNNLGGMAAKITASAITPDDFANGETVS